MSVVYVADRMSPDKNVSFDGALRDIPKAGSEGSNGCLNHDQRRCCWGSNERTEKGTPIGISLIKKSNKKAHGQT